MPGPQGAGKAAGGCPGTHSPENTVPCGPGPKPGPTSSTSLSTRPRKLAALAPEPGAAAVHPSKPDQGGELAARGRHASSQTCSAKLEPIIPPSGIVDRPLTLPLCPSMLEMNIGIPM